MTKQLSSLLIAGIAACSMIASTAIAQPAPGNTMLNASSGNVADVPANMSIETPKVAEPAQKKTVKKAKKKVKKASNGEVRAKMKAEPDTSKTPAEPASK